MFLRNVGSYKSHTAYLPRRRHSSLKSSAEFYISARLAVTNLSASP
jgi:hypothetical protein